MKQKAVLAGALLHQPKLLMLDEPLTGLDAAASRLVKDMIRERVDQGAGVILTTHILEVAERMADSPAGTDAASRARAALIEAVLCTAKELEGFPRHLSQHVGGFVIARDSLEELVPIENATL